MFSLARAGTLSFSYGVLIFKLIVNTFFFKKNGTFYIKSGILASLESGSAAAK